MMIGVADQIFLDTNVLVYANVASSPWHAMALRAVQSYEAAGADLWINRQVLREYLATLTRPRNFPNPMPVSTTVARVRYLETHFRVAEDGPNVTERLLELVEHVPMGGKQIHDANIVATMQAHGIRHLLTHNTADFARFAHLVTVVPLESANPPAPLP